MTTEFERAVDWVARVSAPHVRDGQLKLPVIDPIQAIFSLRLGVYWLPDEEDGKATSKSGRYFCHEAAAKWLLENCERSYGAYDLLVGICTDYIYRGEVLTPSLRTFSVLHMAGKIDRPKSLKAYNTVFANVFLLALAQTVNMDFGLSLTRNDAAKEHNSAADAVAKGLAKNKHHRSPGSIKEICVGTTHKRARQVAADWVAARRVARQAGIIPEKLLDRFWLGV